MDFATRNLYRNAIEELGRGSPLTELRDRAARAGDGRGGHAIRANAIPATT